MVVFFLKKIVFRVKRNEPRVHYSEDDNLVNPANVNVSEDAQIY